MSIGYLDLSSHRGRIERNNLVSLSGVLKKEKIDVLCVTGIVRYPGVATRTDFVDVLSSVGELRNVFGLAFDNLGRQRGNAVFSVYPFHSSVVIPFDESLSDERTSAVLAEVDGGVSGVQVISTILPPKSPEQCISTAVGRTKDNVPLLLLGNLPKNPLEGFTVPAALASGSPIWLREGESAELLGFRTASSFYGKITITQVGLFR